MEYISKDKLLAEIIKLNPSDNESFIVGRIIEIINDMQIVLETER